jgi:capsular polysaccharide export protein
MAGSGSPDIFTRKYRLLTLDPMYSSLHWWIGKLVAKERFAILSSWALRLYVPNFKIFLAHQLTKKYCDVTKNKQLREQIYALNSYYRCWIDKTEKRTLNCSEVDYMAAFYLAVEAFIVENKINLVILHNDTRWHHAVVIAICHAREIPYFVTEQGYLRPSTTMIDRRGSNANSTAVKSFLEKESSSSALSGEGSVAWSHHDSWLSKLCFAGFLGVNALESTWGTPLKYRHSTFPFSRYWRRFWQNCFLTKTSVFPKNQKPYVLLILQLETDSQVLMFSQVHGNQLLIDHFERRCFESRCQLVVKPHPLDVNTYSYREDTETTQMAITPLAEQMQVAFTINSSAIVEALATDTPIYALGDSVFSQANLVFRCEWKEITGILAQRRWQKPLVDHLNFLQFLQHDYLLRGSGFAFERRLVAQKLQQLLEDR